MKKILIIATLLMLSCNNKGNKENKDSQGQYSNIATLLNECKGHAVVVSKAHGKGYYDHKAHFIIIKDADGKLYTYQGVGFDVEAGDTLIIKP